MKINTNLCCLLTVQQIGLNIHYTHFHYFYLDPLLWHLIKLNAQQKCALQTCTQGRRHAPSPPIKQSGHTRTQQNTNLSASPPTTYRLQSCAVLYNAVAGETKKSHVILPRLL